VTYKIAKIDTSLKWVPETCVDDSDHPIFQNVYQKSNDFLQCICDLPSDFRAIGYGWKTISRYRTARCVGNLTTAIETQLRSRAIYLILIITIIRDNIPFSSIFVYETHLQIFFRLNVPNIIILWRLPS